MSARRSLWFGIAGAGLLCVAGYVGYTYGAAGKSAPRGARAERSARGASDDGERLLALERSVLALKAANARTNDGAEGSDVPARRADEPEASTAPEPTPVEDLEAVRAAERRMVEELDERLDTEPLDQGWRVEAERQLGEAVGRNLGPNVRLTEAKCASTMCRVALSHPSLTRLPMERVTEFVRHRGGLTQMALKFAFGEGETTMYAFRSDRPADPAPPRVEREH